MDTDKRGIHYFHCLWHNIPPIVTEHASRMVKSPILTQKDIAPDFNILIYTDKSNSGGSAEL